MANSYLNRTTGTSTLNTKCTFSGWYKRGALTGAHQHIFSIGTSSGAQLRARFRTTEGFQVYGNITGQGEIQFVTNRLFRDTSAWYHILISIDCTQSAANRVKIYVNGIEETSFDGTTQAEITSMDVLDSNTFQIGRRAETGGDYFDGYMSHVAFVDGQALAPTVFGQTDSSSGIWKFKSPSGVTWGNNGFHLKFENSGNLGLDSSGNSNTFTVNGNGRQALDTPSNVHATLNPLIKTPSGLSYSNGNNTLTTTNSQWEGSATTIAPTKGKWYFEAKYNTGTGIKLDIARLPSDMRFMDNSNNSYLGYDTNGYGYQLNNSGTDYYTQAGTTSTWNSSINGNSTKIYMVAVDLDNGKMWFGANGAWANTSGTANPATGADPRLSFSAKLNGDPWLFGLSCEGSGSSHSVNFGNGLFGTTAISSAGSNGNGSLFEYDVPSGYYALNTKNINTYG